MPFSRKNRGSSEIYDDDVTRERICAAVKILVSISPSFTGIYQ